MTLTAERTSNLDTRAEEPASSRLSSQATLLAEVQAALYAKLPFSTTLEDLVLRNLSSNTKNPILRQLAQKWLKNASSHTFAGKHEWIAQFTQNSIDATCGTDFGQNGVGFLSCLHLLSWPTAEGAEIEVQTNSDELDYKITVSQSDEGPTAKYERTNSVEHTHDTTITVKSKNAAAIFSDKDIAEMQAALDCLSEDRKARFSVEVTTNDGSTRHYQLGNARAPETPIVVSIQPDRVCVADNGGGIPLPTALHKLFVASESSKKRRRFTQKELDHTAVESPQIFEWSRKPDPESSNLLIKVGEVVIVSRSCNKPLASIAGKNPDLLIHLPEWTPYTIDNDEIILNPATEAHIQKIIKQTIKEAFIAAEHGNVEEVQVMNALYRGLVAWETTSASRDISAGKFSRFFIREFKDLLAAEPNVLAVPATGFDQSGPILSYLLDGKIALPVDEDIIDGDFGALDRELVELVNANLDRQARTELDTLALDKQLIQDQHLVFIPDSVLTKISEFGVPQVTSAGIRNFVFAPQSLRDKYNSIAESDLESARTQLAQEVIYRYPEQLLGLRVTTVSECNNSTSSEHSSLTQLIKITNTAASPIRRMYDFMAQCALLYAPIIVEKLKDQRVIGKHLDPQLREFWYEIRKLTIENRVENAQRPDQDYKSNAPLCILAEYLNPVVGFLRDRTKDIYYNKYHSDFFEYAFRAKQDGVTNYIDEAIEETQLEPKYGHYYLTDDPDKLVYISNQDELRALSQIVEQHSSESWSSLSNPERCQLISSALNNAIDRNQLGQAVDPLDFCNCIFTIQLARYHLIPPDGILAAVESSPFLLKEGLDYLPLTWNHPQTNEPSFFALGSNVVWPLAHDASAADLGRLFNILGLHTLQSEIRIDDPDCYQQIKLPFAEQDPLVQGLRASDIQLPLLQHPGLAMGHLPVVAEGLSELGFAVSDQLQLQDSFKGHESLERVAESALLCLAVEADQSFSPSSIGHMRSLRASTMHLMHQMHSSIGQNYSLTYGRSNDLCDSPIFEQSNTKQVMDLLEALDSHPGVMEKLVRFQQRNLIFKTSPEVQQRYARLVNELQAVHLGKNSPLTNLALLYEQGVSTEVVIALIESAASEKELMICSQLLDRYLSRKRSNYRIENPSGLEGSNDSEVDQYMQNLIANITPETLILFSQELLAEKVPKETLDQMYYFESIGLIHRITPKHSIHSNTNNLQQAFNDYLDQVLDNGEPVSWTTRLVDPRLDQLVEQAPQFSFSQLLSAHAECDSFTSLLEQGDLAAALNDVAEQPHDLATNKIEQNITHGSERDPVQAIATETLQNSLDEILRAMRSVNASDESGMQLLQARGGIDQRQQVLDQLCSVEYSLSVMPGTTASQSALCLRIQDTVGMPSLKTLLTDFLLPDYSEKEGNLGIMGNGLGQLYKASDRVVVTERLLDDPNKVYLLDLRPQRDPQSGAVLNVNWSCVDVSEQVLAHEPDFYGTRIQVQFAEQARGAAVMDAIYNKHYLHEYLGASNVCTDTGGVVPVFLETEAGSVQVNQNSAELSNNLLVSVPLTKQDSKVEAETSIRIMKSRESTTTTQITTGGLPFGSATALHNLLPGLHPEVYKALSHGFIIDLPLGSYTPVQSRTDLVISDATKRTLYQAIYDAYYLTNFTNACGQKPNGDSSSVGPTPGQLFIHQESPADFEQLRISADKSYTERLHGSDHESAMGSVSYFHTHYEASFLRGSRTPSFSSFIAEACNELSSRYAPILADAELKWTQWQQELQDSKYESMSEHRQKLRELQAEYTSKLKAVIAEWGTEASSDQAIAERLNCPLEDLTPERLKLVKLFINEAVMPWFDIKANDSRLPFALSDSEIPRPVRAVMNKEEAGAADFNEHLKELGELKMLQALVPTIERALKSWVQIKKELLGEELDETPVKLAHLHRKHACVMGNQIQVDVYSYIQLTYLAMLLNTALQNEDLTRDIAAKKLLLPRLHTAGTLNHEIEHVRRSNDNTDFHADGIDVRGKFVDFEKCAISYAEKAIAMGLIPRWIDSVQQIVAEECPVGFEAWLEEHIYRLPNVEMFFPDELYELLGVKIN